MSLAAAEPAWTQSRIGSPDTAASAVVASAGRTSLDVARVYTASSTAPPPGAVLPPNLRFGSGYRPILEQMFQASPTFRRQCLRIANAPRLTITIRSGVPEGRSRARAWTRVDATAGGGLVATVDIRPQVGQVELIAHEIEHVIEQLDGVDLPTRASLPNTGVEVFDDGIFETARAKSVGLTVAREVEQSGR